MIYLWQGNFLRDRRNAGSNCALVSKYSWILMVTGIQVHENRKDLFIIKQGA